ncbi:MAG: M48 family metalloprotease [Rubrivivax sp.]|nr:M48 family metalloprotease [Rubrivivax sp.]
MNAVTTFAGVMGKPLLGALIVALLASCKTMPTSLAGGSPAATPSPADAAAPSPAVKAPANEQQTAGSSAAAANMGKGKSIPLATFEGDLTCTKLVAPFDTADNLTALADLATSTAVSSFGSWLDNAATNLSIRGTATQVAAGARHNIPFEVRATALRMNWLPMKAELKYGRMLLDKTRDDILERDSGQGRRLYPGADKLLADVLKGVTELHSYEFEVFIRTSSGENAMALPGGLLVLDAALVQDPKLRHKAYFAMAHEVAHVLQRHETRAVQARIIDVISLRGQVQDLIKSIRSMRGDPTPIFALALAGKLQFEQHFSSQEMHSDGCAVRILDKVLENNMALAAVLQSYVTSLVKNKPVDTKIESPVGQRDLPAALQSTADRVDKAANEAKGLFTVVTRPVDRHPTPKERIDNLNRTLAEVVKRPKPASTAAGALKPAAVTAPAKGKTLTIPTTPAVKGK